MHHSPCTCPHGGAGADYVLSCPTGEGRMRRREFIVALGGAAATWPLPVPAQQPERMRRIAVLVPAPADDGEYQARIAAFLQGLQQFGWTGGSNVLIDTRWGGRDAELTRKYAAELVALAPEVIMAFTSDAVAALRQVTRSTPIVFAIVADPVGAGYVESLARPGGNITGFTNFEYSIGGKWLETLKDIAPGVTRVAIMHSPETKAYAAFLPEIERVAPSLGIRITAAGVHDDAAEIERVITAHGREPGAGLIVLPHPITTMYRKLIIELTSEHRLPAIYPYRYFAAEGGLISYGVDGLHLSRQAASYVDRILNGAKPADLPVQQPTKFELVVNLKTA